MSFYPRETCVFKGNSGRERRSLSPEDALLYRGWGPLVTSAHCTTWAFLVPPYEILNSPPPPLESRPSNCSPAGVTRGLSAALTCPRPPQWEAWPPSGCVAPGCGGCCQAGEEELGGTHLCAWGLPSYPETTELQACADLMSYETEFNSSDFRTREQVSRVV